MKRIFYLMIGLFIMAACNNSTQIEIKGRIENAKQKELKFSELLVNGTKEIETVKLSKNGSFKFKTTSNIPRFYQLAITQTNFLTLLIEPGEEVSVKADASNLSHADIIGSEGSLQIQKLNNDLALAKSKLTALAKEAEQVKTEAKKLNEINQKYSDIVNNLRDSSIAFIVTHLNSLACIVALYQKYDDKSYVLYKNRDIQYIKIVSDSLGKKYPESLHVKALLADRDNLLKQYNLLKTNAGMSKLIEDNKVSNFPDVLLPNQAGDSISLSSVKAKYILLNFWASWNRESLQKNLELKDIYTKYHSKGFEIYEVSLDTKQENWIKAIHFDQLPWINVIDLDGRMSYFAKIYNVQKLPTGYLINPKGEIVSSNPTKEQLISTFDYALK